MKKFTMLIVILTASIQISLAQNEGEVRFTAGMEAFENGDYVGALKIFSRSASTNPDSYYFLASMNFHGLGTEIDRQEALRLAKKGHEKNSLPATYLYGKYNFIGTGMNAPQEDVGRKLINENQLEWFRKQFEQTENPMYAVSVGQIHYYGHAGVQEDLENAKAWYKKAAEKEFGPGYFYWAVCYAFGPPEGRNYEKAYPLYKKGAELGHASSQNNLGALYRSGQAVEENVERAFYWYNKAANQGHGYSNQNLGFFYNEGTGVEVDWDKAAAHFEKAAATGIAASKRELGEFYLFGVGGIAQDMEKAQELFLEAKEDGDKTSELYLQVLNDLEKGKSYQINSSASKNKIFISDIEMNRQKSEMPFTNNESFAWATVVSYELDQAIAVRIFPIRMEEETDDFWYTNYAPSQAYQEQSGTHTTAVSILNEPGGYRGIAYQYFQGNFYDRNGEVYEKLTIKMPVLLCALPTNDIFENIISSAENGSATDQYELGVRYYKGKDLPQDYSQAFEWLTKAAHQGHAPAQTKLGQMYFNGLGRRGLKLAEKGASNGDLTGQSQLAYHYYFVQPDYSKAAKFAKLASAHGDAWGQTVLGTLYHEGRGGFEKNEELALSLFSKARNQGNSYANVMYLALHADVQEKKRLMEARERELEIARMFEMKQVPIPDGKN